MLSLNITGKTMTDINNTIMSMASEMDQEVTMDVTTGLMTETLATKSAPTLAQTVAVKMSPAVAEAIGVPAPVTAEFEATIPVVKVAPPQGTVELDTDGIPWDKRIHSAGKSLNATGTWRVRRRLDKDVMDKVWAELRAIYPDPRTGATVEQAVAESQAIIPAAPTPTVAVAQPAPLQTVAQPVVESVTTPAPAGTTEYGNVPVPTGTKPAHSLATFTANLPLVLTSLINEGKITKEYTAELCTHFGVDAIWEIASDADKCTNLFDFLVTNGLITKVG